MHWILQLWVLLQLGMGDGFAWTFLHWLLSQGLPPATPCPEAWRRHQTPLVRQARPPILSKDGLMQKEKVLGRLLLPWRVFPRHGTIAADTSFYPFGTRMYIPGYGWGEVEDKGGAIVGPDKIDLYHATHADALHWGQRKLQVKIILPGEDRINRLKVPGALKDILKGLAWIYNILF